MGADIHAHTEVKIKGLWHHYSAPYINRNYTLFAYMAGVRNYNDEIKPIALPRGLPKDITLITWMDSERMGTDGHSHSWLSGEEIDSLNELMRPHCNEYFTIESSIGYLFSNGWNYKEYPEDYPKELEDARIVFWFDN